MVRRKFIIGTLFIIVKFTLESFMLVDLLSFVLGSGDGHIPPFWLIQYLIKEYTLNHSGV